MDCSTVYTDLLLVGKTGNGKSATGNSILGRKAFNVFASVSSVTRTAQIEYSEISGRIIKVVDGPGVCDTDLSEIDALELVVDSMKYAIAASPRGYHAILLVVRFGVKLTNEDKQAVQILKRIFGSDFVEKFAILVVTYGDTFDPEENNGRSFNEWCSTQTGIFRDLVSECNNRVILFDNRTKDEAKKSYQRECLFTMVDSLSRTGQRYSNDHFKSAERERDRILKEAKVPFIREETMMEASLIIQELGKIQLVELDQQLEMLHHLKSRSVHFYQSINTHHRETGTFKDLITIATNINQSIDDQMNAIEIQKKRKQEEAEIEALKAQETQSRQEEIRILQNHIDEQKVRYNALLVQVQRTNTSVEQQYQQVASRQNESLLPLILKALIEIVPAVIVRFFRK